MTDETTNAPQSDESGSWFKNNWKNILAIVGLVGGIFAMMSGAGEMMLLGLLLLGVGLAALFAPETFGQVGDAIGGAWNRGVNGVKDKLDGLNIPFLSREPQLNAQQLATPESQKGQLSEEERAFETWVLGEGILAKLDQKDRENLSNILKKMREGGEAQRVTLASADIDTLVEGLNDNRLPAAEKEALKKQMSDHLAVFR